MTQIESKNYEELAYEFPEIWEEDWFSLDDHDRIRHISELIPADTKTIADIGCGNGLFLNFLMSSTSKSFERLAGVDRSQAALSHVRTEKHRGSIDALPFHDREFDTVTCMEVLEHLSVNTFPHAVEELSRVARRYLLISVPYRQDLNASLSTCPSCCTRFNADFHVRTFDEAKLSGLFEHHGFRQIRSLYLGESIVYPDQELRKRLKKLLLQLPPSGFPSYAVCPVCGFHDRAKLQSDLAHRKLSADRTRTSANLRQSSRERGSLMRTLLSKFLPGRIQYHWICALYER